MIAFHTGWGGGGFDCYGGYDSTGALCSIATPFSEYEAITKQCAVVATKYSGSQLIQATPSDE